MKKQNRIDRNFSILMLFIVVPSALCIAYYISHERLVMDLQQQLENKQCTTSQEYNQLQTHLSIISFSLFTWYNISNSFIGVSIALYIYQIKCLFYYILGNIISPSP